MPPASKSFVCGNSRGSSVQPSTTTPAPVRQMHDGLFQVVPALSRGETRLDAGSPVDGLHYRDLMRLVRHDHLNARAFGRLGIDAACNRAGGRQQADELAGIKAGDLCHGLVQHIQHWHP